MNGPAFRMLLISALLVMQGCAVGRLNELRFTTPWQHESDELVICVDSELQADSVDIPLLLHWQGQGAPYDLIVRFNDFSGTYESVSLDAARVEYTNGNESEFGVPQQLIFEPCTGLGFSQAAISFPGLIECARNGAVVLTGELRRSDGTCRRFHERREFTINSDGQVLPYVVWLTYGIT